MSQEIVFCENPNCTKGEDGGPSEFIKWPINKRYCDEDCKRDVKNAARRREMVKDVVAAVSPAYELESDIDSQINFLRAENKRLATAAEKWKNSKNELVHAFYGAISDAISELTIEPVTPPQHTHTSKSEEIAVVGLSDFQLGKVTPTYNSRVCAERVELMAEKVLKLVNIQRSDHPVSKLHVWLCGDIIEGQTIFPGQVWLIDSSLYRQITVDAPRILCKFLRTMLTDFDEIHVCGVIGNHGRLSRRGDYDPETNGDRMVYRIIQQILENEPRITWDIPDGMGERNWYTVDHIGKYSSLLVHGDQFTGGGAGFPAYSVQRKVLGWKSGGISVPFQDVTFGHLHQTTRLTINHTIARCIGSTECTNTYAQEVLAASGSPSQMLMFVEPKDGRVTAEYQVLLD